jgi:GTP-binding protein
MSNLASVAIVGRPNVGKSTLFNRLLGRQEAVSDRLAGVTRDRKEEICEWRGRTFYLVDTGGWETGPSEDLQELVARQVEVAVRSADVVLFVVDASTGILPQDAELANLIRKRTKGGTSPSVIVVANKADSESQEASSHEAHTLGLGDVVAVSALHGRGTGDLLDRILEAVGERAGSISAEQESVPSIAIVGRPNVGKSTLFNRLVAEERSIVSDVPGTTRDAIDSLLETEDGKKYRFIDTAGLKKATAYSHRVEYYSATRTMRAIDRADVALLVLDASAGVTHQDQAIAQRAVEGGCGVIVVLNKWDLLDQEQKDTVISEVGSNLRFVDFAPLLRVSALSGRGVSKILPTIEEVLKAYDFRSPTAVVNSLLADVVSRNPPPVDKGRRRRPKVLYATQVSRRPPTFVLFTGAKLPKHYLRYLENQLRKGLGIGPTPVKMKVIPRSSRRR